MTYKVVIIDDELATRKLIANMLKNSDAPIEVVGEAGNIESGLILIKEEQPHIVLLDIQMPDGSGFDLLKKIKERNFEVIFITAHEEYAIRAIKFSALDYILKPIEEKELLHGITNALEVIEFKMDTSEHYNTLLNNIKNENKKLVIRTKTSVYVIDIKDIVYCQSDRNYTFFYLMDGKKILTSRLLKDYEDILVQSNFIRCHRSYIINLNHLDRYDRRDGGIVVMKDGSEIPISRSIKDKFIEILESL
ncbi:MAG: response regulator transcription factor [Brumimicrobium sp.]|nr:response regulator transcription factor [Brumimicrobium sp.]